MSSLFKRVGVDTRYLIIGFPTAIVAFALLVTFLAAGAGTAVIGVGLLVLGVGLRAARGLASVERVQLPAVLDRPNGTAHYRRPPEGAGWFRTAITPLSCGQSWMDLAYGILRLPMAIAGFVIAVVWWAVAIAGITWPLYGWTVHNIPGNDSLAELLGLGGSFMAASAVYVLLGVFAAITLPLVLRFAALLNAGFANAFLSASSFFAAEDRAVGGPRTRSEPLASTAV